jgi:uncharacterized protein YciI
VLQEMKAEITKRVAVLPTHEDFLQRYCPADRT